MASILDGLKNSIVELLRPGTRQALGEREVLRQMYENTNAGSTLPNTWYRVHGQSGACVGFAYVCNCNTEYQLISAFEWYRDYKCNACGAKFDLLKHVGIKNVEGEITKKPEEWERLLSFLPIRPRLAGTPQVSAIDTWAELEKKEDVVWAGSNQYPPNGWV